MVRLRQEDKPLGFLVVYEDRHAGDADQEIDFGIVNPELEGRPELIRQVRRCILAYLFTVRRAASVSWNRRARSSTTCEGLRISRAGREVRVSRQDFVRQLQRSALPWPCTCRSEITN